MALPPEARAPKVKKTVSKRSRKNPLAPKPVGVPFPRPKKTPKPKLAAAPNFPKKVPVRPGASTSKPTRKQVRNAKIQQRAYKRQAGAVRRAAQTQSIIGPGIAVPHKKVQRPSTIKKVQRKRTTQSLLQERKYVSQGSAVKKVAGAQAETALKKKYGKNAILFSTDRKKLQAAGFVPPTALDKAITAPAGAIHVLRNAIQEGIDIPANVIPTASYIASPVIKHPTKGKSYTETGKRIVNAELSLPKELIKHPGKTLVEHPLSSALLVAPVGKLPIRGVRAVGRRIPKAEAHVPTKIGKLVYKKQQAYKANPDTLLKGGPIYQFKHPYNPETKSFHYKSKKVNPKHGHQTVSLPGTRLKVARPVTTGYARNIKKAVTAHKPTVTAKEIDTRIDEDVALMEGLTRREGAKAAKKIYRLRKKELIGEGLSKKAAKKQAGHEAAETAQQLEKRVRREETRKMVNTYAITDKPHYVHTPYGPQWVHGSTNEARIFKDKGIAERVAEQSRVGDVQFKVHQLPGKTKSGTPRYVVIPKAAIERFQEHTAPHAFSPAEAIVRMYSTTWRRNVLALHPTWYTGNVLEAALRSAISGVGPSSFYRGIKVAKELKTLDPQAARMAAGRIYGGGHLAMQANLPREYGLNITGNGSVAKGLRALQQVRKEKPTVKNTIDAWEGFSDFTMGTLSGGVEGFFQKGMLGKALSKDPIMDGHMIKISKAAISDAARGLRNTENQVKMGRAVDEMYGRYGKWSPGMRRAIANYTPFISWTMNALNFLYRTLPRDHPVLTAAIASAQPYVEQWRKDKGLSYFVKGAVPAFLQGAVPTDKGFARYPTRYTPFAVAANPQGIADLVLPQFSSALNLVKNGINWKGQRVKNPDGSPLDPIQLSVAALLTLYEGAVPASQTISQPEQKYEKGERNIGKLLAPSGSPKEIASRFDPFKRVPPPPKKKSSFTNSYFPEPTQKKLQRKQKSFSDSFFAP